VSRKHNCKHPNRGLSKYKDRLRRRGLGKAPRMESLVDLKGRQKRIEPIPETEMVHAGWSMNGDERDS